MPAVTELSGAEIGRRGSEIYAERLRCKVESPENIGKMVIIDIETGEYEVDDSGLDASRRLHSKRPGAPLYGVRIGYNVAESVGGVMERTET